MKVLLAALRQTHRAAVRSSVAGGGLAPLREEALVVGSSRELVRTLGPRAEVRTGFITEEEEGALLRELEPGLKKKRYEWDHWDDAIHGYRETERVSWGSACEEVMSRVRSTAFPEGSPLLGPVHILDLDKTGYIKPHIDSVKVGFLFGHIYDILSTPSGNIPLRALTSVLLKFCGSTIAGLSLLSDSIMRLVKEDSTDEWMDLLLPRRSLYILRDQARYDFTHQILKDEESVFNGRKVPRLRRISIICRNLPG
ncbi:alpha-ketoglutarate-dependent dioxygenase alkB homolog 7, mitochondrial isoform 1-T1 [Spinachia spinachia]